MVFKYGRMKMAWPQPVTAINEHPISNQILSPCNFSFYRQSYLNQKTRLDIEEEKETHVKRYIQRAHCLPNKQLHSEILFAYMVSVFLLINPIYILDDTDE